MQTLFHFPGGKPISSLGVISEISITFPSAGEIIRLFAFEPDNIGVTLGGFLKKYMHHKVKMSPIKNKGDQIQPIIKVIKQNIIINGNPEG